MKKMSKQKNEKNIEASVESKDQKFRRVSNLRVKRAIYEINRLANMPSQPTYDILDTDAQKILNAINSAYIVFSELYTKIASGQSVKISRKEQQDIF
jgi:hypothetical protein